MAVWNLGSINIDHVYRLGHLPRPGETQAALGYAAGLGGKGANQSVAAARAGATVRHLGAIGPEGLWARDRLAGFGVDTAGVAVLDAPTGHAIILLEAGEGAENAIVIHPGANRALGLPDLTGLAPGDYLLMQNETSAQQATARAARALGAKVVYSAAPFDLDALAPLLPLIDILALNEGEAAALVAALGQDLAALALPGVLVTKGAAGADWWQAGRLTHHQPAFAVTPLDTTGAGDTMAGWFTACLDRGLAPALALRQAAAAAALQVTRPGAAEAIPTAAEVAAFLAQPGAPG